MADPFTPIPPDFHALPDASRALEVVMEWLADLGADPMGRAVQKDLRQEPPSPGSLRGRLTAAGLDAWAASLSLVIADDREAELAPGLGGQLLGQAGVELAVRGDHPLLFALADELWTFSGGPTRAESEEIVTRLRQCDPDHPLLTVLVERLIKAVQRDHRAVPPAGLPSAPSLRRLWPGPYEAFLWNGWACNVAARVWPGAFMTKLALLPSAYAHAAVTAALPVSVDELVALLVEGAPVFDATGGPTGEIAIFAALEVLHDDSEEGGVRALFKAPTDNDLNRILDAVLMRPDGVWLARAWAQRIVWTTGGSRSGGSGSAPRRLMVDLLNGLSGRLKPIRPDPHSWIEAEGDLWRVDRVLVEAMVLLDHGQPGEAAELLAEGIRRGAVTTTGRAGRLASTAMESAVVGSSIAAHPDPVDWFSRLWRQTYDRRERGRFARRRSADNPAIPALAWGVQGLNYLEGKGGQSALWAELSGALAETRFTDPGADLPHNELGPITRAAGQVCAHMVDAGALPSTALSKLIAGEAAPTEAFAWFMAHIAGSPPSPNLLAACRQAGKAVVVGSLAACLEDDPHRTRPENLNAQARARLQELVAQI